MHQLEPAGATKPASQARHELALDTPSTSLKRPVSQATQRARLELANEPNPHVEHADAPESDIKPGSHAMHDVAAPNWFVARPGWHATHTLAPVEFENVPEGQAVHVSIELAPETALKVPSAHGTHDVKSSDTYFPAAHDSHALAPSSAKVPNGHSTHAVRSVAPATPLYLPYEQLTHDEASSSANRPAGHTEHEVAVKDATDPGSQDEQDDAPTLEPVAKPSPHSTHDTEPAEAEKVPALHTTHVRFESAPLIELARPGGHATHRSPAGTLKKPASHSRHASAFAAPKLGL